MAPGAQTGHIRARPGARDPRSRAVSARLRGLDWAVLDSNQPILVPRAARGEWSSGLSRRSLRNDPEVESPLTAGVSVL